MLATGKPITGMNLGVFWFPQKQVCLPVSANRRERANVYEVTQALQTHSGGNVAACFSDRLKWTLTEY